MNRAVLRALGCAILLSACNGNEAPKPEMAASAQAVQTPSPSKPRLSTTANATELAPTLALQVVRTKAGVGLRVINAGEPVSLAPQVSLERLTGDRATAKNQALTLRRDCKSTGCVTLTKGAEIDAPSWLEQVGGERCDALLVPPASGRYRLRVQTCAGSHSRDVEFVWPVE